MQSAPNKCGKASCMRIQILISSEPSGSGSLLKRRSDEMNELWL